MALGIVDRFRSAESWDQPGNRDGAKLTSGTAAETLADAERAATLSRPQGA